jgi:phenylpropionate dioxygenase-like ring-hydroxylating dioxygenase large terminal subunit
VTNTPYYSADTAEHDNYPFNCWFAIATSDEIGAALVGRRILGRSLVLFRQTSGEIAALDDRCSHRAAPLSTGQLVDDQVVCPYHGFTYAANGVCVRVPSQRHVPYGARVRSYPIREEPPFVWIWLGNPVRSGSADPPDLPWLRESGWKTLGGSMQIAANYMLLHDNALDRTHFPYVHPHRIHRGYVEDPPPLQIEVAETTVSYTRTFTPAPLADWQHEATGLPADGQYTQRETGTFVSPAMHVDMMDILAPGEGDEVYRSVFIRAFTPIDAANTLILWRAARNFALDDESVTERLREVHEGTMREDQPLLETIQANAPGRIGYGVSAAADAAAIRAYQIVDALIAEERGREVRTARLRRRA